MAELPSERQFGDYGDWPGRQVLDPGGERLGAVREIYLDRETHQPEWVLVAVDGGDERFVPLADAAIEEDAIRVAHRRETVAAAPGIGTAPRIDPEQERRLYAHYGVPVSQEESSTVLPDPNAPASAPEPESQAAEPEPEAATPEPQAAAPEPQAAEPEPPAAEPEPQAAEPEPQTPGLTPQPTPPAAALTPQPEPVVAPEPETAAAPPPPEPEPAAPAPSEPAATAPPAVVPPPPAPPKLPPPAPEAHGGVLGSARERPAVPIAALVAAALALLVLVRKLRD